MTQYKVGSKVLVRGEVADIYEGKFKLSFLWEGNKHPLWIDTNQIYSLAPEFGIGEQIEVSNDQRFWERHPFALYANHYAFPYRVFREDGGSTGFLFARKLQPKDEPVTAEEIARFFASDKMTDSWQSFVNHFKGRRIGGDK